MQRTTRPTTAVSCPPEHPQGYGCDRCGASKAAHREERLECPGRGRHSTAVWSDSLPWVDDGHALTATLSHGWITPWLVHPEGGCRAVFCGCMGEEAIERDPDPNCPTCHGDGRDPDHPCWLQHVVEELGSEFFERTRWETDLPFTVPVAILHCGDWDDFEWRPRSAAKPAPGGPA